MDIDSVTNRIIIKLDGAVGGHKNQNKDIKNNVG